MPMFIERPAIRDPMKKTMFAMRRIGLRPQMSEILPHIGVEAALASRYAEPIQVYPAEEWKCSDMVGRAVVMIVCRH
jgi:hypothetical protein